METASKTARGGEPFAYSITVSNIGSAKATDVILIQNEPKLFAFTSYVPSKGKCEVEKYKSEVDRQLNCRLDDIELGNSIIITVEMKATEFGDASITEESIAKSSANAAYDNLMRTMAAKSKTSQIIGNISVSAKEDEENRENNHVPLSVELLPSRNIPPRVEIISPKNEETFTRSSKKLLPVTFKIRAYDPDGAIEKVSVDTQQFSISVEYPENKYVIDGVKYSIKEVEGNMSRFQKYFGGDAVKTGKDTYTFTLENPQYGFNNISIHAYDDGGRVGTVSVRLTVKGDNSIEFTKPVQDSIIKPHTDVVLETETKFNDGKPVKLQLIGTAVCCGEVLMKQISRVGNVYRHQYTLKNVEAGRYGFQVLLFEDTGAFTYSEGVSFKVTEKPMIKITSLKNQQIFKEYEDIPIEVEAADADGEIKDIVVSVNGKYGQIRWRDNDYRKKGSIDGLPKGVYRIAVKVEDDLEVETESEPLTIVVR